MSQTVLLGDIAEVVMGQSPEGASVNVIGVGTPLLNGPTEFGSHNPTPKQFTSNSKKISQPGDLLFCVRGSTTGRMNWCDQKYAIGRGLAAIRSNSDPALNPYIRAVIELSLPSILSTATGSTFPNVSAELLKSISIKNYDKRNARVISHILTSIDEKIELNRRMNETLEQIGQQAFEELLLQSKNEVELEKIVNFNPREPLPKGADAVYLEMKNLSEFGLSVNGFERKAYSGGTKFRNGDTLLARITPCLENGKTGYVDFLGEKEIGFGSTEYIVMRPDDTRLREYVYHLARSKIFRAKAIQSMVGTSGRQRVQTDSLRTFKVAVPSSSQIDDFYKGANIRFEAIKRNSQQVRTLTTIRDNLLPKLLSGRVEI